jgi:hypothetical protein
MSLAEQYPKLEKIMDCGFIKRVVGTSKKEAAKLLCENEKIKLYLKNKERDIEQHNKIVQDDLVEFFSQPEIQKEIEKFKKASKSKSNKDKSVKEEIKKQAIIEEYLREQELKKKREEERQRLGMNPNNINVKEVIAEVAKSLPTPKYDENTKIEEKPKVEKSKQEEKTEDDETIVNLEEFYNMFTQLYEGGHVEFKNGNSIVKAQISMDGEKVIVQFKTLPTITIKK